MARQNVRLPILTIERVAPFFWVSLGLQEADRFRVALVEDFDRIAVEDANDLTRKFRSNGL